MHKLNTSTHTHKHNLLVAMTHTDRANASSCIVYGVECVYSCASPQRHYIDGWSHSSRFRNVPKTYEKFSDLHFCSNFIFI